jgi:hypothetical protein
MNIQLVRENLEYKKSARYAPLSSLPTAIELELICIVHLQQELCAFFRVAFGRKISFFRHTVYVVALQKCITLPVLEIVK